MRPLLERSVKGGLITQDEYSKVVQDSEERAQLLAPSFKGWYDRGFNLSFNDNAFFLKIRFRSQLRFTERIRNDAWRDPEKRKLPELLGVFGDYRANRSENNHRSMCAACGFTSWATLFDPDFKYYIQFRSETAENAQTPGALSLLDMNFTSTHFKWANVQLGQYKVYFNRSQINSTASIWCGCGSIVSSRCVYRQRIGSAGYRYHDHERRRVVSDQLLFRIFNGAGPSFQSTRIVCVRRGDHRLSGWTDRRQSIPFTPRTVR